MACSVTAGIGVNCKDAVGGVRRIYISDTTGTEGVGTDFVAATGWAVTTGTNEVTGIAAVTFHTWEAHPEKCNFSIRTNASPESGTLFYEQTLSFAITHLDGGDAEQLRLAALSKPLIAVELVSGKVILMGCRNGCDVNGGGVQSGQRFGDEQGMTIDFITKEYDAQFFWVADIATFEGLSGVTIN